MRNGLTQCPHCKRWFDPNTMVVFTEDNVTTLVCTDCYDEVCFERTEIWKECLKSVR